MAVGNKFTGIDTAKTNQLKIDLLGYVETLKSLNNRLEDCKNIIQSNMEGPGEGEIVNRINFSKHQITKVSSNINSYFETIGLVEDGFRKSDIEAGTHLIKNISKIDSFKEE